MRLFGWLVLNSWHPLTYEFVCLVGFRTRYKRHLVVEECVGSSFPQNGCPAQRWNMAVIISKFVAGSRANITLSQEIRIVLTMSWFVRVKERFLVSILSISSSQARRPNRSVHFFIFSDDMGPRPAHRRYPTHTTIPARPIKWMRPPYIDKRRKFIGGQ